MSCYLVRKPCELCVLLSRRRGRRGSRVYFVSVSKTCRERQRSVEFDDDVCPEARASWPRVWTWSVRSSPRWDSPRHRRDPRKMAARPGPRAARRRVKPSRAGPRYTCNSCLDLSSAARYFDTVLYGTPARRRTGHASPFTTTVHVITSSRRVQTSIRVSILTAYVDLDALNQG